VIAKAEWTGGAANPRFVVTSLSSEEAEPRRLYEEIYCARGDMENRIKECQLDLFADRTSAATMRANQLRLWFASMAYVLLCALRRIALQHTHFAKATCGTIRLKLLNTSTSLAARAVALRGRFSINKAYLAAKSPWLLRQLHTPLELGDLPFVVGREPNAGEELPPLQPDLKLDDTPPLRPSRESS
jgi:hypothetical protein